MNFEKKIKISSVMSVYNGQEFIEQAIKSILTQTYTDFEFIIIDDGSTDNSLEIARCYATQDNRIRVIMNETNIGMARSLNKGIALARGKYIARMDSDDISLPDRFEKQVAYLEKYNDVMVLGTNISIIDDHGKLIKNHLYPLTPGLLKWRMIFGNQIAHPSAMMRSCLFSEYGYSYKEMCAAADYEFWARVIRQFKLANLDECLLKYRVHSKSISFQKNKNQKLFTNAIIREQVMSYTSLDLPENLVERLLDVKTIHDIKDALLISKVFYRLHRNAMSWELSPEDKHNITKNTEQCLMAIWKGQDHNLLFLPYVVYSRSIIQVAK